MQKFLNNQRFLIPAVLLGLWLGFDVFSWVQTESLWFEATGNLQVFSLQLQTRLGLWVIALLVSTGYLFGNLALAHRFKHSNTTKEETFYKIPLQGLLFSVFILSLILSCLVIYYALASANYWHPELNNLLKDISLPPRLQPKVITNLLQQIPANPWLLAPAVLLSLTIIFAPGLLWVFAAVLSLSCGLILSNHWAELWQFFNPISFNASEPVFRQDISFYVFILPILELLEFWLLGLSFFGLTSVSLIYLLSGNSLSEGKFPGFSQPQLRHLDALGSAAMLTVSLAYWLRRYQVLYSPTDTVYGAGYTQVNVELPAYTSLSLLAAGIAGFLIWKSLFGKPEKSQKALKKTNPRSFFNRTNFPYPTQLIYGITGYTVIAIIAGIILPSAVQRTIVQPNEIVRERPYIQRNINFTRSAFNLKNIEVKTFTPEDQLTFADLQKNDQTIRNIRLWDTRPLLETNRQLQQIRLYYKFPNADIDRYTLKTDPKNKNNPNPTEKQQVILAARELDYTALPAEANTWLNKHLVYTHGYGFTMSPVNTVAPGGLPDYFVKNIGEDNNSQTPTTLQTSSPRIRESIPIGKPRIYYGEITNNYIIAPTKVKELDYPSGETNVYNTYDGSGGIAIKNWWHRLIYAKYLNDWQMLLTDNITPQTKLLFRRQINQRVQAIAPFLRFDSDPYLVITKANLSSAKKTQTSAPENYLYWIIDAYTTSNYYPYSDPGKYPFNYIRNSVKIVIDAYNGNLDFYIADNQDPIIQSWSKIFPGLFHSFKEMPASLRSHIRYPIDLFDIQSQQLLTFHATDPQVFYNRDDQWQVPTEIYGSEPKQVEPYYLIMKLATAESEEFILLHPFTPTKRTNLIAWLAGRLDGNEYGKLLLYQFPKQRLVFGPEQIEARINQDPAISQQISLWNRQGSKAIQGNLLVIPIEQSLLYVEPLYLEAAQNSLPTLVRVIVAYENQIAMAETLEQALEAIFKRDQTTIPVILSPGNPQTPALTPP
ncbi:UPF0182 family protein [Ancylothrix sp. C2]|uniref:UPF0182 family protein n=1 Tax=Ancylothrix sp. D3o TaxID=2953691 RepID=UPI0021BB81E2|nr:UPF0182 family protein [Ancylothrix sp. D3o]MCT7949241.1 UPF0182 family protein [Ancylothrix sp. D3o]